MVSLTVTTIRHPPLKVMATVAHNGESEESDRNKEQGTPCRLVGRFAPISGTFTATRDEVSFLSNPHLSRQIAVKLVIPTRAIKDSRLDADGRVLQVGIQGMTGRSLGFEYNNALDCSEAAMALAQAGVSSHHFFPSHEMQIAPAISRV